MSPGDHVRRAAEPLVHVVGHVESWGIRIEVQFVCHPYINFGVTPDEITSAAPTCLWCAIRKPMWMDA